MKIIEEKKQILAKFFNARKLRLKTDCLIKKDEESIELFDIVLDGKLEYSKGDKVYVVLTSEANEYKTYYVINRIFYLDEYSIEISEFNITDSTIFILPLLGLAKEQILYNTIFINAYIQSTDFDNKVGEVCHLVYRYLPFKFYTEFKEFLCKQANFSSYKKDYIDNRFDRFTFLIPKKFIEDIKLILDNKHNEISEEAKTLICDFHSFNNSNELYTVINNNSPLKEKLIIDYGENLPEDIKTITKIEKEIW